MNIIRTVASVLALAFSGLLAQAPGRANCPDISVRLEPGRVDVIGHQECSAGISGNFGAIRINVNEASCPVMVLITPPRDVPVGIPNCGTYAVPVGFVAVERVAFRCDTTYLLFIPLHDTCVAEPPAVVAQLATYAAVPCGMVFINALVRDATPQEF